MDQGYFFANECQYWTVLHDASRTLTLRQFNCRANENGQDRVGQGIGIIPKAGELLNKLVVVGFALEKR